MLRSRVSSRFLNDYHSRYVPRRRPRARVYAPRHSCLASPFATSNRFLNVNIRETRSRLVLFASNLLRLVSIHRSRRSNRGSFEFMGFPKIRGVVCQDPFFLSSYGLPDLCIRRDRRRQWRIRTGTMDSKEMAQSQRNGLSSIYAYR